MRREKDVWRVEFFYFIIIINWKMNERHSQFKYRSPSFLCRKLSVSKLWDEETVSGTGSKGSKIVRSGASQNLFDSQLEVIFYVPSFFFFSPFPSSLFLPSSVLPLLETEFLLLVYSHLVLEVDIILIILFYIIHPWSGFWPEKSVLRKEWDLIFFLTLSSLSHSLRVSIPSFM